MKVISVSDLKKRNILDEIVSHLDSDGLLIYPTDTLYGIGCNLFSLEAQDKIDVLKGREDVPYSAAIPGLEYLKDLTSGPLDLFDLFSKTGSFSMMTFLFRINKNIDKKFVKYNSLIGIRIFNEGPLKELLALTGSPLITTSVNSTGEQPLNSPETIRDFANRSEFSEDIIFIDNGSLPDSKGSTIVDLSGDEIKIVREGDNFSKVMEIISKQTDNNDL